MFEAYKVGVTLSLTNKVTAGLLLISKDLARTQGNVKALQDSLNKMKLEGKKAAYELGAAFAVASPFLAAINSAAKLQKEMIGIQQATGATTQQIDAMRLAIERTAGTTIFSSIDVAKMAKTIGTGTTLNADQVSALIPEYAKFADVQYLLKGTSAQQSVKEAVKLAHTAGHYSPEELREYLNLLTRLSMVIPGGLSEAGNALKYSQTEAKRALGIGDTDMVEMIALLNQLGFSGSRGGTNFIAAASRSIPGVFGSGLLTGKSGKALRDMGMADASGQATFFENGKFSTHLWMKQMAKFVADTFKSMPEAEARQYILTHFRESMGVNGSRVATLLADPAALHQLAAIDEKFRLLPDNENTQEKFARESTSQKIGNLGTNFSSLLSELGYPLLPTVNEGLDKLNNGLKDLIEKAHQNSGVVKGLGYAFGGLSALLGFAGIVHGLKFAFKGLKVALTSLPGLRWIGKAFKEIGKAIGVIGGGATLDSLSILAARITILGTVAYGVYKLIDRIHQPIADFIDKYVPQAGDWLMGEQAARSGSFNLAKNGIIPPYQGKQSATITVNNVMDKRILSSSVHEVFMDGFNSDNKSPSWQDMRQGFPSPAWTR